MFTKYLAEIILLTVLPLLLVVSGFFSGSETALFSLSRHERLRLARAQTVAGHTVNTLLHETRALLITLLLGNMTVNVLYFALSTLLLIRLQHNHGVGGAALTVLSIAPLVAIILLGEVLPKLAATRLTVTWSKVCAVPLLLVHRALGPLRWGLNLFVITPLARLIAPRQRPDELSPEELQMLLDLSQEHGVIDRDEERLLAAVLELGQIKIRELMTPRVDIKAFNLDDPPQTLIDLILETQLTSIPVFAEDLDHIVGRAHAREVLLHPPADADGVHALVHDVTFVPEQQRADQLLGEFRKTGATFAIVVDEYGGTSGLITLEDIVEHMVGDIAGPYESTVGPSVTAIGRGRWRAGSDLTIRDWPEAFGAGDILAERQLEGIHTLGGLVMAMLGRLPTTGDTIVLGNVVVEVEAMQGPRIASLLVRFRDDDPARPESEVDGGKYGGAAK